ncbi:hypothetical protein VP01_4g6 [Puccinia sorghi]|uniref:Uncharacterized protein n=1 Tax=Puccinia sorghi TaxID=27349 RepID=A0A0L6ULN8_9BASI|nr:hypothetical protein VP01_4g6 [Puccinia sorghi]
MIILRCSERGDWFRSKCKSLYSLNTEPNADRLIIYHRFAILLAPSDRQLFNGQAMIEDIENQGEAAANQLLNAETAAPEQIGSGGDILLFMIYHLLRAVFFLYFLCGVEMHLSMAKTEVKKKPNRTKTKRGKKGWRVATHICRRTNSKPTGVTLTVHYRRLNGLLAISCRHGLASLCQRGWGPQVDRENKSQPPEPGPGGTRKQSVWSISSALTLSRRFQGEWKRLVVVEKSVTGKSRNKESPSGVTQPGLRRGTCSIGARSKTLPQYMLRAQSTSVEAVSDSLNSPTLNDDSTRLIMKLSCGAVSVPASKITTSTRLPKSIMGAPCFCFVFSFLTTAECIQKLCSSLILTGSKSLQPELRLTESLKEEPHTSRFSELESNIQLLSSEMYLRGKTILVEFSQIGQRAFVEIFHWVSTSSLAQIQKRALDQNVVRLVFHFLFHIPEINWSKFRTVNYSPPRSSHVVIDIPSKLIVSRRHRMMA